MLQEIVLLNGLYDVLCSLCILQIINIKLIGNLHKSMIKQSLQNNKLYCRILGFFILLYGLIRIFGNTYTISISYLIESLYYLNELHIGTVDKKKSIFVITTSGIMCLYLFDFFDFFYFFISIKY